MPRILVIGSGGREHALAWRLSREADVFIAPGNPGTAEVGTNLDIRPGDQGRHAEAAKSLGIDLVVVGPEDPLIAGLGDSLRDAGVAVFGPGAAGARLEGSKAFAKEMMIAAGVPTAAHKVFTDPKPARSYARERFASGKGVAVKASGAALGKGVVVCSTLEEADEAIDAMLVRGDLGAAGAEIVIEDRLRGEEFSLIALCAGASFHCLPVARDYKRALDGDRGPNTGGMGTFSPVADIGSELIERAQREILAPILNELLERGIDFRGALFAGIMVENGRPYCLEYNVRFGDPETQTVVRRLEGNLFEALLACARGEEVPPLAVAGEAALTVVMASAGYPGPIEKDREVAIGPMPEGVLVFQAGTTRTDGRLVTSGGRVLGVSAMASTVAEAREAAYQGVSRITFEGAHWRRDIGSVDQPAGQVQ